VVETSYFELCFLLGVLSQNLHICSFLLILFISYYICTLQYLEVKSRIAGTWQPFMKMPCTYVHCLTPSPPNVQLMLSGGRVNMLTAPNHKLGSNAGSSSLFLFPLTPSSTIFSSDLCWFQQLHGFYLLGSVKRKSCVIAQGKWILQSG